MKSKNLISTQLKPLFSKKQIEMLIRLRRDLHQHPELSLQEKQASQILYDHLAELKPNFLQKVANTGVVARFKGKNQNAPVVALRGDIDALPIQEETGLAYASQNPGVMHACGHDIHATWTIGAAFLLQQNPAAGDVIILLQPAEELAKGARAILKTGLLDDADFIFGGHVDRHYPVGQVVVQEGPLAASADIFEIELTGKGSHGARPHEAIDPVVGAAELILALQTIISRRIDPAEPGVVSVCMINGGTAHNIIPAKVKLSGTIRAVHKETREFLKKEVKRIVKATAELNLLEAKINFTPGTPPIENPAQTVAIARKAVTSVLGEEAIIPLHATNMAAEDFAYYMEKIPGCFMRIGASDPGGKYISAHSPNFHVDEGCIFVGAAVLAETARVATGGSSDKLS